MAVTTFAAIDIGSYEVSMKIFEISKKHWFPNVDDIRYRLESGKGYIPAEKWPRNGRCYM